MENVKISAVSYLNTKPFTFGIEQSGAMKDYQLELDIPAVCAEKLLEGKVDVGLIPVAVIPLLKEHYVLSDYCIGAVGAVNSVVLYSNVPFNEIKQVKLDYQSRTSVTLVKVLSKKFWKINPEWITAEPGYENKLSGTTAGVIIGDRTFGLEDRYLYKYDLAEEWMKYTNLPFVFACWVANKKLPESFIDSFNLALKYGIDNRPELIRSLEANNQYKTNVADYLNKSISYELTEDKRKALSLFLRYIRELE